jgi:hypothetical protein
MGSAMARNLVSAGAAHHGLGPVAYGDRAAGQELKFAIAGAQPTP